MKVVVTGGLGFIGSHLVDRLVELGHSVVVIDDKSSTLTESYHIVPSVQYYTNDVADYDTIRPLFDGAEFVFHLAAESRIPPSIENPIKAVKTNVLGTATVLQCAREAGVKRVMYSSTSSAYGNNDAPQAEWQTPDPLNPYSVSKLSGEHLCKMYTDLFGLETVVFRYFNVYGPREPLKGTYAPVVGLFLQMHREGKELTVTEPGTQKRDFVHVNDVVEANILAMDAKLTSQDFGRPINIGTSKTYSILKLAKLISNDIRMVPARPGEAKITQAGILLAKKLLNWEPKESIEEYIRQSMK